MAIAPSAMTALDIVGAGGDVRAGSRIKTRLAVSGAVMSSAPTITAGTAYANSTVNTAGGFSAPTIPWTSPMLTYPGSIASVAGATAPNTYLALPATTQIGASTRGPGGGWSVRFVTDSPAFDFLSKNASSFNLIVDGQLASTAGFPLSTGPAGTFYTTVDFGSSAVRHIEIVFASAFFGGINVGPNYSVWGWPITSPRMIVQGDSYTGSTGAAYAGGGWAYQLGRLLGMEDNWLSGVGGTGYLSLNGVATFRQRLATDVIAYNPQFVIVAGGINDNAQTPSALQTEVGLYARALLDGLPLAQIVVLGPWRAPAKNPSQSIADAIKAGWSAQPEFGTRVKYIDTFALNYQFGTGFNGTGNNDGNSYRYIGSDGLHPLQLGHDYLAQRTARDIAAAYGWTT